MTKRLPTHPQNSEGDFYVVDGECMGCGAPEQQATRMMAHDLTGHCFFVRQPESSDELNAALRALWSSCCGAVRYGGIDPFVLTRLAQMGLASACDQRTSSSMDLVVRNHARLTYVARSRTPVKEILDFIVASLPMSQDTFTRDFDYSRDSAAFVYEWGTRDFRCSAKYCIDQNVDNDWVISIKREDGPTLGLAMALDTSLRTNQQFGQICWLTTEQLSSGDNGTEHPY